MRESDSVKTIRFMEPLFCVGHFHINWLISVNNPEIAIMNFMLEMCKLRVRNLKWLLSKDKLQAQKPGFKLWCHNPRALLVSLIFSLCSLEVAHREGVYRIW